MLAIKNLTKEYQNFKLNNINIDIKPGSLFGCLGANGAGKSTLIRILTGQTKPTSGEVKYLNTNVINSPIKAKAKIGIIPEQESPPSFLTVQEYLEFICKVRKISNSQKEINHWLNFLEFEKDKNSLIKNISRGTKQKVLITQSFIHKPKLVFIDEPLINLDPLMQKKFKEFLQNYTKKENTVFLSTHVLSIAKEICTDICILKNGHIILNENVKNLQKKHKNLEEHFLKIMEK
jgi:ABC-2 type transport system ATP-binding protein